MVRSAGIGLLLCELVKDFHDADLRGTRAIAGHHDVYARLDDMNNDPITLNNRLGHYSYFANLLDLCAVAIPNGVLPNGIPMGVTLLAPAWTDRALIALARRLEVGATGTPFALTSRARPAPADLTDA